MSSSILYKDVHHILFQKIYFFFFFGHVNTPDKYEHLLENNKLILEYLYLLLYCESIGRRSIFPVDVFTHETRSAPIRSYIWYRLPSCIVF